MTAAEILAALNELPADEHAAVIAALQNDSGAVVKAFRSKVFAAGKAEGKAGSTQAAADLAAATERAETAERDLEELKKSTPDAAAIEQKVIARLQPKLDAEKQRADTALAALRRKDETLTMGDLLSALGTPSEDGTKVSATYFPVIKAEFSDRIRVKEDGTVVVLQLDSEVAYEAPDPKAAVRLLAADLRKQVPAGFIETNADNGGGVMSGGRGGSGGSVATVAAIAEQKQRDYTL